jgi:protein O-GlcNAc transferase
VIVYPEIGMHAATIALAARRIAPVQIAAWGHPVTTGLATIDAYLSVAAMEPDGAQAHYREALHLLPGIGTACPVAREPLADRAEFGLARDRRLYLAPQSLFKIHPDDDATFAAVLARDPSALLVMFASPWPAVTQAFLRRFGRACAAHGVEVSRQVAMLGRFLPGPAYRRLNAVCDIMLDTSRWSGGNTSLDALAQGLPVVALPGNTMRSRQSAAMLRLLGEEKLVARDRDDFVDIATRVQRADCAGSLQAVPERFADPAPIRALGEILYSLHRAAR